MKDKRVCLQCRVDKKGRMTSAPLKDILIVVREDSSDDEKKEKCDKEKKKKTEASVTSDQEYSVSEMNIFRALTFLQRIYAKNVTLTTVLNHDSRFTKLLLSLLSTGSPRIQRIVLLMLRDVLSNNPNTLTPSEKSDFVTQVLDRVGRSFAVRTKIGDLYAKEKPMEEETEESKNKDEEEEDSKEEKSVEENTKEEEKIDDEVKEEKTNVEQEDAATSWHCSICTFANESSATVCSMCGTPGANNSSNATPWICSRCTLRNVGTAQNCVLCSAPRTEPAASNTTTEAAAVTTSDQQQQELSTTAPPTPPSLSRNSTTTEISVTADVEHKEQEEEEEVEQKEVEEEEVEHK